MDRSKLENWAIILVKFVRKAEYTSSFLKKQN